MKVAFIRLDMRGIKVVIFSALMVLSGVWHGAYAQQLNGNCVDVGIGNCACAGATKLFCNGSIWIDGSSLCPTLTCSSVAPTVTTTSISSITATSASSGGNVTSDGGADVIARGVCWSESVDPTTSSGTCTTDSVGTGDFTSSIIGLTSGTTYYVKAYATNSAGTAYGSQVSFGIPTTPTVTTNPGVDFITETTASPGGNVTSDGWVNVTARGVCWGTSANPTTPCTTNGTGTGAFTSPITGLTSGTKYYVRAYATNTEGTTYGSDVTFTTIAAPTVTTGAVSGITTTGASGGGEVTSDGGETVTARGVCWSESENPSTSGTCTTDGTGTGAFTSSITGLDAGTDYHVRAYATNNAGTSYGDDLPFTTADAPTVTTTAANPVTKDSATTGGTVTSDGGEAVTARGVCWSESADPNISGTCTTDDGTGTGTFTSSITGLSPGTTYHVRAYATNSVDTAYGSDVTFITDTAPTVTTTVADPVTQNSATTGGTVTSDGGEDVTERGVCWSLSADPNIVDDNTVPEDPLGTVPAFTSVITGLDADTTYHVRAYATNSAGTAYGSEVSFKTDTPVTTLTVTTNTGVNPITETTASSGGEVTSDGGTDVTARGVCWSESADPNISGTCTTDDGTGTGTFTSSITGLSPGTTYHVRAYATNSVDTAYGSDVTFITDTAPTVSTTVADPVTQNSATTGGTVTSDGGDTVTERGVCWSTSADPNIDDDSKLAEDPLGTDPVFTSVITGLTAETDYHVRAYATNSVGTSYGEDVPFTTAATAPTVTTTVADPVTQNSATTGGTVTSDGGEDVTARGVCWSESADPTIVDDNTVPDDSPGTGGSFTSEITGLSANTTYHVRAYATNNEDTSYGNDVTFVTLHIPGNIDCNGDVDLADLILALKISAGIATTDETVCNADVNNDGKIGVEELIYILQEVLTTDT